VTVGPGRIIGRFLRGINDLFLHARVEKLAS
jgi:hypothetical protein